MGLLTKKCPFCGKMIMANAGKCWFCGEVLEASASAGARGDRIDVGDMNDVRAAAIGRRSQAAHVGNVEGSFIQAQGNVTVGKELRDEQYQIALNWDGQTRMRGFDLSGRDLSGLDLTGADLAMANLAEADLHASNLRDATLSNANLQGANLQYANLRRAFLFRANLRAADLSGANVTQADLSDADLTETDLRGARLHKADLEGANLRGANLSHADLSEALIDLERADVREANLTNPYEEWYKVGDGLNPGLLPQLLWLEEEDELNEWLDEEWDESDDNWDSDL